MKTPAVSIFGKLTLAGTFALLSLSQAVAEDRPDVLERIAPIGKVTIEDPAAKAAAAAAPAAAESAPADGAGDGLSLATSSGCMGCHQVDTKVVGPAYKEVAAKYKDDAGALDMLVNKVLNGGTGTWGQVPMPPNAHVGEEKVRTIVTWVLGL